MNYFYLIITLAILLLFEKVSNIIERRHWESERRSLYNRIQAGTLRDYAINRKEVEEKSKYEKRHTRGMGGLGELHDSSGFPLEPSPDFTDAQSAAQRLVG